MTATEELRHMLDERGVKWWPMHDDEAGYHKDRDTEFLVYGCKHVAHEWGCRLQVDMLTPAQAIAATLGSGTCVMLPSFTKPGTLNDCQEFCCSVCGEFMVLQQFPGSEEDEPSYCPNCGRKVVDE